MKLPRPAHWNAARPADGWVWGEQKDADNKINPWLITWKDLPDRIREFDREFIEAIPDLLAIEGLTIRRIE